MLATVGQVCLPCRGAAGDRRPGWAQGRLV